MLSGLSWQLDQDHRTTVCTVQDLRTEEELRLLCPVPNPKTAGLIGDWWRHQNTSQTECKLRTSQSCLSYSGGAAKIVKWTCGGLSTLWTVRQAEARQAARRQSLSLLLRYSLHCTVLWSLGKPWTGCDVIGAIGSIRSVRASPLLTVCTPLFFCFLL